MRAKTFTDAVFTAAYTAAAVGSAAAAVSALDAAGLTGSMVLKEIGYPRIKGIIYGLIMWLQDINWPGAFIVIEILSEINKNELLPHIERTLIEAGYDDSWIYGIKLLVDSMKLTKSDFSNGEIYRILDME